MRTRENPLDHLAKVGGSICARAWAAIPTPLMIALTSPGIVYKDLLIVGGREPESLPCAPGDIRAYDVRSARCAGRFIPFLIRASWL